MLSSVSNFHQKENVLLMYLSIIQHIIQLTYLNWYMKCRMSTFDYVITLFNCIGYIVRNKLIL